ncbi:MAG: Asp23/Gls24 family envelope stress response protein [Waddliaceae bacterium]
MKWSTSVNLDAEYQEGRHDRFERNTIIMNARLKKKEPAGLDKKEFELPETVFVRDIENRVFQSLVVQCLAKIDGISLEEGNFIDNILGRDSLEGIRGVHTEQDNKHQCVSIRVEINIGYGISIPKKAEEIQSKIAKEVTQLTGLHVSSIHVIFKNIVPAGEMKQITDILANTHTTPILIGSDMEDEYNDEF